MKTLLVASTGGHLAQLYLLSKRMGLTEPPVWVTFDTPQSRSLLANDEVHFAPFAGTRDILGTARAATWARRFLRQHQFDVVVSTGASIALSFLPLAARSGANCYYVESATRVEGPSLTGRLLEPFRSLQFRTQHERWANKRWKYQGSIFDGYRPEASLAPCEAPKQVVVSLGMHKDYGFRRLIERLGAILPPETDVLWQVGNTDTAGLDIEARRSMSAEELSEAMAASDVVVTHAGMGSAITALEVGKRPIFVPRRHQFKEHVDDHQVLIAADLDARGLALCREADQIEWNDLIEAATWRVEQDTHARPFTLGT